MIDLIHSRHDDTLARTCLMNRNHPEGRVHSLHLRNDGSIQTPCALGPEADCRRCRSVTHVALHAGQVLRDKQSLLALFRMYHAKYQTGPRPAPRAGGRDVFSALGGAATQPATDPVFAEERPRAIRLPVLDLAS
jgi:hypothetical protein